MTLGVAALRLERTVSLGRRLVIICETNGENCLCHRRGTDSFRLRFYSFHSRMYRSWKSERCSRSGSAATLAPPASTTARTSFNPANRRATETWRRSAPVVLKTAHCRARVMEKRHILIAEV